MSYDQIQFTKDKPEEQDGTTFSKGDGNFSSSNRTKTKFIDCNYQEIKKKF